MAIDSELALKVLTAALLRIAAGGGRPEDIPRVIRDLAKAHEEGGWNETTVRAALGNVFFEEMPGDEWPDTQQGMARNGMVVACMRQIAAKLLDDRMNLSKADSQMSEYFMLWGRGRDERIKSLPKLHSSVRPLPASRRR